MTALLDGWLELNGCLGLQCRSHHTFKVEICCKNYNLIDIRHIKFLFKNTHIQIFHSVKYNFRNELFL